MKKLLLAFAGLLALGAVAVAQTIVPFTAGTRLDTMTADTVALTGGTINGIAIGGTVPAAGTFTTLSAGSVAATGAGQFAPLYGGGTSAANASLQAPTVASAVNQVVVSGAATGAVPSIAIGGAGADANRNLNVAAKGTGIVTLGQSICTVSGASPQTCNGQRGIVTSGSLSTAALTNAAYTINNSSVTASSLVICKLQAYSGTLVTNGLPSIMTCVPGAGTITVNITNLHSANALSGTVAIGFAVLN